MIDLRTVSAFLNQSFLEINEQLRMPIGHSPRHRRYQNVQRFANHFPIVLMMRIHQTGQHLQNNGPIDGELVNDVGNEEMACIFFGHVASETFR